MSNLFFLTQFKMHHGLRNKYGIKDGTWKLENAKKDLLSGNYCYAEILVKAFDKRHTLLNRKSSGFLGRPRYDTMKHMVNKNNLALLLSRQNKSDSIDSFYITDSCSEMKSAERTIQSYHFPLYTYPDVNIQKSINEDDARNPNFDNRYLEKIVATLELEFLPEEPEPGNLCMAQNPEVSYAFRAYFTPLNLLDYIYAVLHSPSYREKYKEFLKIDFPRVPYPRDTETFWQLVELGGQIRELHLMESPKCEDYITTYPIEGDHLVSRKMTKTSIGFEPNKDDSSLGKVWINDKQYFDGVPELAWNFYIGGYQPAQKWLKDRQGRNLSFDDILHYQKIIVILTETDRLMKEIDNINFMDESNE